MRGIAPVSPTDRHTNTAAGILPRFIESILQGRRLSGHTPGLFRRNPVFADTATHAPAFSTNERTPALSHRILLVTLELAVPRGQLFGRLRLTLTRNSQESILRGAFFSEFYGTMRPCANRPKALSRRRSHAVVNLDILRASHSEDRRKRLPPLTSCAVN